MRPSFVAATRNLPEHAIDLIPMASKAAKRSGMKIAHRTGSMDRQYHVIDSGGRESGVTLDQVMSSSIAVNTQGVKFADYKLYSLGVELLLYLLLLLLLLMMVMIATTVTTTVLP